MSKIDDKLNEVLGIAEEPNELEVIQKETKDLDLTPKEITAAVIKLKSPITIFKVQRAINDYQIEPLQAIIPGIIACKGSI